MTEWFMCIFARTLPWASVLRVWDMFFCEGTFVDFQAMKGLGFSWSLPLKGACWVWGLETEAWSWLCHQPRACSLSQEPETHGSSFPFLRPKFPHL